MEMNGRDCAKSQNQDKRDISRINGKFNEIRQNLNSCLLKWKRENVNEMQ